MRKFFSPLFLFILILTMILIFINYLNWSHYKKISNIFKNKSEYRQVLLTKSTLNFLKIIKPLQKDIWYLSPNSYYSFESDSNTFFLSKFNSKSELPENNLVKINCKNLNIEYYETKSKKVVKTGKVDKKNKKIFCDSDYTKETLIRQCKQNEVRVLNRNPTEEDLTKIDNICVNLVD